MLDHDHASDLAFEEGVQELRIIAEGDASVRVALRAEQVGVGQDAAAAVHPALVYRREAQRATSVKPPLAQGELVDVRRRRPTHSDMGVVRIVPKVANAGMGFELAAA